MNIPPFPNRDIFLCYDPDDDQYTAIVKTNTDIRAFAPNAFDAVKRLREEWELYHLDKDNEH